MEDRRIYLLAQFDESTHENIAAIYDQLAQKGLVGEQTKDIPYHFTLGSFDLACEAQILERVKAVSKNSKAFDITLSHIGLFGQRILFLTPSMNTPLLNLYDELVPDAAIDGVHNWVAHATILIDTPENIQTAIPLVAQSFSPFTAKIQSIGVYEFFPKKFIAKFDLAH